LVLCNISLEAQTPPAGLPVFEVAPEGSSISFFVKSSIKIKGVFDKWEANLSFTDPTSGVLDTRFRRTDA